MIFVTIGTTEPFDRLLDALAALGEEDIVVQCGGSTIRSARARYVDYLDYDEVVDHVRRARLVISHAGVGTILTALASGKRPIVVPRRAAYGEAVDDHQVELARRLAEEDLVALVENPAALPQAVRDARPFLDDRRSKGSMLVTELRRYLESEILRGSRS